MAASLSVDPSVGPKVGSVRGHVVFLSKGADWTAQELRTLDAEIAVLDAEAELPMDNGTTLSVHIVGDAGGDVPKDLEGEVAATLADMDVEPLPDAGHRPNGKISVVRFADHNVRVKSVRDLSKRISYSRLEVDLTEQQERRYAKWIVEEPLAVARGARVSDADCNDPWSPYLMIRKAGRSSVSGEYRYGDLEMYWNANRLGNLECYEDVTYEPDFVTNNNDGLHYFTKTIVSWASNFPSEYKDTSFGDSDLERVYTVGTSRATQLNANTQYDTYFRTEFGNASTDGAKIISQRGNRTPSYCDSTWCIFARESSRVPDSGWPQIPGENSFTYPYP